jgi:hypothetical protein
VIDRHTGTLVLSNGRIACDLSLFAFRSSPMAGRAKYEDMGTGWVHVSLEPKALDGLMFGIKLIFEGERLDSYSLWLMDARHGSSWRDGSEEKELARRDAHDAWLVVTFGSGERRGTEKGPELRYTFPWGEVWSSFDAGGGSSSIGVRFRRGDEPGADALG